MAESQKPPSESADPLNGEATASAKTRDAEKQEPHDGRSAEAGARGDASAADPLAESRAEVSRLKDAWMRTAADFDNFRKRARRELEDARKGGREEIVRDLLPVFDNLERGIQSARQEADVKAVTDGLQMILKQFESTLGRMGISKIGTVGIPFDPGIHEAIQQVETSDHAPGTVVAEVQPGYMAGERLIRAAMVVVAKPKSAQGGEGGSGDKAGEAN
jgi:molecular chaperone GrpE